jgi:hypothetical protein
MIIGLFELIETISQTLPNNLTIFFYQYGLKQYNYCICEKWKVNLITMTIAMKSTINCKL